MKTEKFVFKLEIEAVPYTPETVEELFGKGAKYNPIFSKGTIATDLIFEMIKDAITYCLESKMDLLVKTGQEPHEMNETDKAMWDYYEMKENKYREIEKTVRPLE